MSNIFKKPKGEIQESKAKYELLNLKENPFPFTPFVNKANPDDRYNGRIYESKIREIEHEKILQNFIRVPQNDPSHIRLGFILDYSYVGRGNGKSAFTLNLIDEINKEYCLDISEEKNKCFGLYISPESGGRTKTFASLLDLIFNSILENNIINYSLASLRLEALESTKLNLSKEFNNDFDLIQSLNNPEWFESKEIKINEITNKFYSKKEFTKVSASFPLNRDRNTFYGYRITNQEDFKKYYYETLKSSKEKSNFIFNDLVLLFLASGFNGAFVIIDDFERIPDFQSEKLKQEFALEVRTNFFDGYNENAKIGFYNLILVLHAGVPRLIEKAWTISGMNTRSPLISIDEISKHIIKFDKLSDAHAKLLLVTYLKNFRIKDSQDDLYPFTADAVNLISEKSELNASSILEKAHALIEAAAEKKISVIDAPFVTSNLGMKEEIIEKEEENISKEKSIDLFRKAKKKKGKNK